MKLPNIKIPASSTLLAFSCVLTLIGLALMTWSMLDPTVWPIMIAMSGGQVVGTLAFGLYLFCVIRDVRQEWSRARTKRASAPPPEHTPPPVS